MLEILSDEAQALARGMLLGDRSGLTPEMVQTFRSAGMSHILAVSGMHVGIIMSVVWMLLKPLEWATLLLAPQRMWVYYSIGMVKRFTVIGVTILYVVMIGAPTSAVRAALMLSLTLIGWMMHRTTSGWRCLLLAALILLAWDPWSISEVGFQLSFLAVAGILLFQPWLQSKKCPRWFRLILLSVAAQWLTTPIVAYWFHQVPVLGWLQGLLVVPWLPAFVVGVLLLMLFPTCGWIAYCVELMTHWIGNCAELIGQMEQWILGGHVYLYPEWWEVVLAEVLLLAIVVYLRLRRASGNPDDVAY